MKIKIQRFVRTANSEVYLFFSDQGRLGHLDLHYQDYIHGNLILEIKLSDDEFESLLQRIDAEIIDSVYPRKDFMFSVFQGDEIGFYSDHQSEETREYETARIKDINHISTLLKSAIGKQNNIRGKLTEHMGVEFFELLGFECCLSKKIDPNLDHKKVDLVAIKNNTATFIQVKSGAISDKDIKAMVKNVSEYNYNMPKNIAFLAEKYSKNSEVIRSELENKYDIKISFYHLYQVIEALPEYKNSN